MTPALTVTTMSKSFGGQRALDSVSLTIEPGEIRALVGQNGCGKSTLIKILAGFHEPDEGGSAEVGGGAAPARQRRGQRGGRAPLRAPGPRARGQPRHGRQPRPRHGLPVLQGPHPLARRSAGRPARPSAPSGYDFDVRRPVASLAMSERTAVAIARALSTSGEPPKLLILDEPTANLPAAEAERLYQLIHRVSGTGLAVLFVSHHFDEVFELAADRHGPARRQAHRHPTGRGPRRAGADRARDRPHAGGVPPRRRGRRARPGRPRGHRPARRQRPRRRHHRPPRRDRRRRRHHRLRSRGPGRDGLRGPVARGRGQGRRPAPAPVAPGPVHGLRHGARARRAARERGLHGLDACART